MNNRMSPIVATCLCIIGICSLISLSIKTTDKIIIARELRKLRAPIPLTPPPPSHPRSSEEIHPCSWPVLLLGQASFLNQLKFLQKLQIRYPDFHSIDNT